ncbi:hypothetical protein [Enterobacter mori]
MTCKPIVIEYLKAFLILALAITGVIKSLFFDLDYFLLAILMVLACVVCTGKDFSPSNLFNSSTDKEE